MVYLCKKLGVLVLRVPGIRIRSSVVDISVPYTPKPAIIEPFLTTVQACHRDILGGVGFRVFSGES